MDHKYYFIITLFTIFILLFLEKTNFFYSLIKNYNLNESFITNPIAVEKLHPRPYDTPDKPIDDCKKRIRPPCRPPMTVQVYVHYLIGMCHYETIEDEKRDSAPIIKAKEKFIFLIEKYPDTDFALDAQFKLGLIQDILAAKEMYLGRHYIKKGKWISAINRFKNIINEYDQTVFVEEALHRLVEINYKVGLLDESQKYATLLGYNYQSGEWYKKSYKVFNKNYKNQIKKPIKKDKKGVIAKFKKLFD